MIGCFDRSVKPDMSRKLLLLPVLIAVAGAQQSNPNFIGNIQRLTETPPGQITYIHFDAGARTRWHVHEKGQLVFVEEGVGLEQQKGGPVREIHAGEVIWCPPGVPHWHGAAPDKAGTQYNVTRGKIEWLDQVTEQEYTAKPVRLK
jgi:quercetin dioxygenase-like cupin family protein